MKNTQISRVQKAGSSLAVIIPRRICQAMGIQKGDLVALGVYDEYNLTIHKLSPAELLQIKPPTICYEPDN